MCQVHRDALYLGRASQRAISLTGHVGHTTSVTRWCKISPLWWNFKHFLHLLDWSFIIWQNLNRIWQYFCLLLGKFLLLKIAKNWRNNLSIWSHCTMTTTPTLTETSVTRLDDFWKFLFTIFRTKEAQIIRDVSAFYKNITFKLKIAMATFGTLFEAFGQLLIPTPGHTD